MKVFVVCKAIGGDKFEFVGVFSSEEKAITACRDSFYFIGPATLDEDCNDDYGEWPGAYYPKYIGVKTLHQ